MPILTDNIQTPSVLESEVEFLYNLTKNSYRQLVMVQKQGIQRVWANPRRITPQEVFDGLGTDAVKMIEFHAAITTLIVTLATQDGIQPDIALPTKAFTKNQDGTVTVLDTPYVVE